MDQNNCGAFNLCYPNLARALAKENILGLEAYLASKTDEQWQYFVDQGGLDVIAQGLRDGQIYAWERSHEQPRTQESIITWHRKRLRRGPENQ